MSLFIKEDVLKQFNSVCDIELKSENYLPSSKVVVGHAVRAELKKASVSSEALKGFRDDCLTFLSSMCKLLLKKSPLSYSICKSITFCDPSFIYSHASLWNSRLTSALNTFADRNRISSKDCDKVSKEFRILTNDKNVISLCKEYDRKHQRVDHFWRDLLKDKEECKTLYKFLREVLILSHGQAFVERGFSINKEIIVENQLDESLVAQRLVYDGVVSAGGVSSITVDKSMILSFRNARDRYGTALEKRREGEREEVERLKSKRVTADRLSELKAKKAKLMTQNAAEMSAIDDEMNALRSQL
ncbi:hypothetical protein FOCC_FOCC012266 [Frankliniella occidentalis]|nr:hypothetical protein FOCC_FOCC012266 [Frankliniella occidentalis]